MMGIRTAVSLGDPRPAQPNQPPHSPGAEPLIRGDRLKARGGPQQDVHGPRTYDRADALKDDADCEVIPPVPAEVAEDRTARHRCSLWSVATSA